MKKLNKLFAILIAVLGVTTLKAQTDVTSLYLTNADFETGPIDFTVAGNGTVSSTSQRIGNTGWVYTIPGWTNASVIKNNAVQIATAEYSMPKASSQGLNSTIPPTSDNNDNKGAALHMSAGWGDDAIVTQVSKTELEVGTYELTYFVYNQHSNPGIAVNFTGVKLADGSTITGSLKTAPEGQWISETISFVISTKQTVTFNLGFTTSTSGSGNGAKLYVDNLKLTYKAIETSEQSWIAPVVGVNLNDVNNSTELYMYNVKADAFASSGMSWGTHAIVKELQNGDSKLSADVHRCRVSKPTDGQLQIMLNEKSFLGGGGPTSTNDCWVDHGSNNKYIYNEVSTNVYTLKPTTATNDSYLDCSWKYGGHITFSATNGYGNTEWAFVLRSDITSGKYLLYKAKKEMYDIYAAVKEAGHDDTYAEALAIANVAYNDANATAATINAATKVLLANVAPALTSGYFSANSLFKNPDMRGYGDDTDWGNGLNAFGDGIFESWHSSETITQKQTGLPNGFYTVEFIGIYRQDGGDAAPTLTLTSGSNSAKANLKALTEIDFGNCSGGNKWTGANKPDDKYSAGEALAHTDANVKVENFFVENGELTVTVAMPSGSQWLLCQGFQIYFKAESLEQYANLFREALAAAETIDTNTLNTYAKGVLSTALGNAANEQIDKDWYQARTAELNDAVALANAVVAPYADAKALFTICENILNNSQEFVDGAETTFSSAVNTAKTDVETATTADAINNIYNTLETARQTYVQQADPLNGFAFDYTFLVVNPGFDNGKTGWESTGGAQNKAIATNKANGIITGTFFENWNPSNFTGEIYQTISNLPSGVYKFKVAAYGAGTNVYANDKQTAVTTSDGAWYEVDQVKVGDGTLKFGIKNENATTWMGIDNASLEYYGFDVATAQSAITSMVVEAEELVGKPMNAGVASALQAAIDGADATKTTRNELSPMIEALSKAIADANVSINDYSRLAKYIEMTKVFKDVNAYETDYNNGVYTADDVERVRQELNVLRFNAASEIFPNKFEVTGWEGSMGGKNTSGQHWDGTDTKYYDNNSWNGNAHSTMTSIELPKGTYVLKAALRSHPSTSLSLTVLDKIVNVDGKGDTGYGIDTEGNANFSVGGTYANNNAGRGWEWEFVKFELEETTTVTLKVECNYNGVYGWASFSDITLWMDDETYMTVYGHAINEPLAAAKALVDTKPMGTDENDALKAAIALGENVSTAQKLTQAIEELNTAVANANAWIPKYNAAKEPLVAALERFETDYNDGANGCLYHLQKAAWSTVIEKVQAAAEAKDVTNSYAGFETATTELVAALDAAQASINMYAKLKAEIAYAQAYTPLIEGNAAGHTAAITEAQTAYSYAETADASELILAMQNYKVLDYTYVTETYTTPYKLGEWTGKTNLGKGEHWSGDANKTYFDYSKWANKHNNGANEATQTIKLPAGKYVLMAAGRAANVAGTEAYIKVNDTKVNFAAKGAYGYGISTNGMANFTIPAPDSPTYARNNEGYGWEYRFIEFTLTEETEVTLVAGMTIDVNATELSWASVCAPVLYTTPLDAAKNDLQKAIDEAEKALGAYPVGEEAFQVSETSDLYVALKNAIATAQNVLANATTDDALTQAIKPLNTAVDNYTNGYELNNPEDGEVFNIVLVYAGWDYDGKAMTYIANDRKDHGLYNIKYKAEPNANYAQAFTFTAVEGKVNHYTLSMTDVDGNERYVCTGTVYGGNASQIRTTTEADKALAVKVIATSTDGIWNLYNTEANNYIGSQDEGVYTVNSHINFNLIAAEKAEVTLKISSVGWATLILPFNAELPTGVVAYESGEVVDDAVQLVRAESLVANTPYLIKGTEGTYNFSGYGLATEDSYTKNLFVGTYVQKTAEPGSYVLQNPKDRGLGFYLVSEEEGKQPTVGAYRSYMQYTPAEGQAASPMFRIGGSTGIDNATLPNSNEVVIYDLMGRKVTTMEKGNMYIINGRKVIVK